MNTRDFDNLKVGTRVRFIGSGVGYRSIDYSWVGTISNFGLTSHGPQVIIKRRNGKKEEYSQDELLAYFEIME